MLARIINSIFPPRSERARLVIVSRPTEAERERQQAMDREKRDLFYSLGFDLSDDSQSWLRQAQLMKQFDDDIQDLRDRVSKLEGR